MRPPTLLALLLSITPAFAAAGEPPPTAQIEVEPATAKPGDPLLITVTGVAREEPRGTLGEQPLRFYEIPGGWQAVTGLPVELLPGTVTVQVEAKREGRRTGAVQLEAGGEVVDLDAASSPIQLVTSVAIVDPRYPSRELTVAKQFVEVPPSVRQRIKEDQKAFERALAQPFSAPLFDGDFVWPVRRDITAPYGDLRVFNGKKQSQHFGVDLDGKVGDPIGVSNDGVVVLVRDCYASGDTVIIHHGAGLYTLYFHLSEYAVKQGDRVRRGDVLGKVGRTGRVTGPHLHWSVKAAGLYVDGATLVTLRFAPRLSKRKAK